MAKADPRIVTRADHDKIQSRIHLQDEEDYAVTIQKGKGFWVKTVHVFARRPSLKEINDYEQTASRIKFRGSKAEMEGSQIQAAVSLYNLLVARCYDVLVGMRTFPQLDAAGSRAKVDPLIKREAVRELIGEVYSATRMEESLGGQPEEEKSEDAELEDHTSAEAEDSEPQ
jgi:hypothetical protein